MAGDLAPQEPVEKILWEGEPLSIPTRLVLIRAPGVPATMEFRLFARGRWQRTYRFVDAAMPGIWAAGLVAGRAAGLVAGRAAGLAEAAKLAALQSPGPAAQPWGNDLDLPPEVEGA